MIKLKTVIIKSSFKEMLTNISIDFLIKSAVIKSILLMTFALKAYYLSFKVRKTVIKVLKYNFSHMKLLCWIKIIILFAINMILIFKQVYFN